MKFAKVLDCDAVPEWRPMYLDYKGLKKLLAPIAALQETASVSAAAGVRQRNPRGIEASDTSLLKHNENNCPTKESSIRLAPNSQVTKTTTADASKNKADQTTSNSASTAADALHVSVQIDSSLHSNDNASYQQVGSLRSPLRLSSDSALNETPKSAATQPNTTLTSPVTPSRRISLFSNFTQSRRQRPSYAYCDPNVPLDTFLMTRPNEEVEFFRALDLEVKKIQNFFNEQIARNIDIFVRLKHQANFSVLEASSPKFSKQPIFKLIKTKIVSRGACGTEKTNSTTSTPDSVNPTMKKSAIKRSLLEFYRGLSLLHNFQVLNHTALVKILKKFSKTANWQAAAPYTTARTAQLTWQKETAISELMRDVENLFCKCFFSGKRAPAMRELRLPDNSRRNYLKEASLGGLCLGSGVALCVLRTIDFSIRIANVATGTEVSTIITLVQIYCGLLLPLLFAMLFGLDLDMWVNSGVNYVFVFEFDPRDHVHHTEYLGFVAVLFLLWAIAFYVNLGPDCYEIPLHAAYTAVCALLFFNPFPVMYRSARFWLLRSSWSALTSATHKIQFADFFLTDILCSLTFTLTSLPLFTCYMMNRDAQICDTSKAGSTLAFALIPQSLRLIQCVRRAYDARQRHPHLTNALKYFCGCSVMVSSYFSRVYQNTRHEKLALGVWIMFALVSTLFSTAWDFKIDWGLADPKHSMLRAKLSFSPKSFYYAAIVSNIVLRFCWLLQISPGWWAPAGQLAWASIVCSLLEVVRRAVWCLFRMENEHLTNCGKYRAVKEIPVPSLPLDYDHTHSKLHAPSTSLSPKQHPNQLQQKQSQQLQQQTQCTLSYSTSSPQLQLQQKSS